MGLIAIVAVWSHSAQARSMLVPLVLPERLIITLVVLPKYIHVSQKIGLAIGLENGSNVGVFSGRITESIISAIAVIRP